MCAAARLAGVFRCCVTSQRPVHQTSVGDVASLAADKHDVASTPSTMRRCRYSADCGCAYITLDADDPSVPVPVCCCERCDGGWFPPEVSVRMRSCILACDAEDHVTSGKTLCDGRRRHCAWTGDVIYLDDTEKAEMSLMSRDFQGVDLLVRIPLVRLHHHT